MPGEQADESPKRFHGRAAPNDQGAFPFLELELVAGLQSEAVAEKLGNRHLTLRREP